MAAGSVYWSQMRFAWLLSCVCVHVMWRYAKDWLGILEVCEGLVGEMRVVRQITKAWALELCCVHRHSLSNLYLTSRCNVCGGLCRCVDEQASGVEVASFWPKLFVNAMGSEDMNKLICSLPETGVGGGDGGGGGGAAAAAPAAGGGEKKEEKKKAAPPPEEDEDMGFSLFD